MPRWPASVTHALVGIGPVALFAVLVAVREDTALVGARCPRPARWRPRCTEPHQRGTLRQTGSRPVD